MEYSELEETRKSIARVEEEIRQHKKYIQEWTGYLKLKLETRSKLQNREQELMKGLHDGN